MQVSNSQPTIAIRRLSYTQLYALHMGGYYKLRRSSMGWWPHDHPRQGVSELVRIIAPSTIKSLWRLGLMDGIFETSAGKHPASPELWTNQRGKLLLIEIMHDTGLLFDPHTDELVHMPDCMLAGAVVH